MTIKRCYHDCDKILRILFFYLFMIDNCENRGGAAVGLYMIFRKKCTFGNPMGGIERCHWLDVLRDIIMMTAGMQVAQAAELHWTDCWERRKFLIRKRKRSAA